jgi:hypothetical protein
MAVAWEFLDTSSDRRRAWFLVTSGQIHFRKTENSISSALPCGTVGDKATSLSYSMGGSRSTADSPRFTDPRMGSEKTTALEEHLRSQKDA